MARITHATDLPGPISAAEDLWYDLRRRVAYVEGFGHVAKVEGDWPRTGSRVIWDAPPGGRGRVVEAVEAHEDRTGQTVAFEDEDLRGTQTTSFAAVQGGLVRVTVTLEWRSKEGSPLGDWVFGRRKVGESLRRTLVKYRIERLADLDDEQALQTPAP